jgi:hypothetical protein
MQNIDHNIGFWEKRQFYRQKLSKIAENCDHNIDPWSHCWPTYKRQMIARDSREEGLVEQTYFVEEEMLVLLFLAN